MSRFDYLVQVCANWENSRRAGYVVLWAGLKIASVPLASPRPFFLQLVRPSEEGDKPQRARHQAVVGPRSLALGHGEGPVKEGLRH